METRTVQGRSVNGLPDPEILSPELDSVQGSGDKSRLLRENPIHKILIITEGKMEWMRNLSWIVTAVALFVISLSGAAFGKDPAPPKKTPDLLNKGKKIFEQTCAPCHGSKGDGKGPAGAVLKPPPTDFQKPLKEWPYTKGDLQKLFEVISKGIPNSSMVAWTQYSEQERWALTFTVMEFAASPAKKGK